MSATQNVEIGCQRVASSGTQLCARGVGPCLVVSVWDGDRREGGLAHLPLPRRRDSGAPAECFVDSGLARLIQRLRSSGSPLEALEVRAAGAAEILRRPGEAGVRSTLAACNLEALQVTLERLGLQLAGADIGGDRARNVVFEVETGLLHVTTL
ncbi:MAG: chemotaxis protein CheD [Myxococcota bacterium]